MVDARKMIAPFDVARDHVPTTVAATFVAAGLRGMIVELRPGIPLRVAAVVLVLTWRRENRCWWSTPPAAAATPASSKDWKRCTSATGTTAWWSLASPATISARKPIPRKKQRRQQHKQRQQQQQQQEQREGEAEGQPSATACVGGAAPRQVSETEGIPVEGDVGSTSIGTDDVAVEAGVGDEIILGERTVAEDVDGVDGEEGEVADR